jgi:glycosyltransferase involved in cell wall biosynthesis
MNYGTPLVSSNATCLPEVYQNGAHYFDPENIEDIAAKINDVLEDQTLRDNLIAEGKKVIAGYSWKRMAQETLDVYKRALERK